MSNDKKKLKRQDQYDNNIFNSCGIYYFKGEEDKKFQANLIKVAYDYWKNPDPDTRIALIEMYYRYMANIYGSVKKKYPFIRQLDFYDFYVRFITEKWVDFYDYEKNDNCIAALRFYFCNFAILELCKQLIKIWKNEVPTEYIDFVRQNETGGITQIPVDTYEGADPDSDNSERDVYDSEDETVEEEDDSEADDAEDGYDAFKNSDKYKEDENINPKDHEMHSDHNYEQRNLYNPEDSVKKEYINNECFKVIYYFMKIKEAVTEKDTRKNINNHMFVTDLLVSTIRNSVEVFGQLRNSEKMLFEIMDMAFLDFTYTKLPHVYDEIMVNGLKTKKEFFKKTQQNIKKTTVTSDDELQTPFMASVFIEYLFWIHHVKNDKDRPISEAAISTAKTAFYDMLRKEVKIEI